MTLQIIGAGFGRTGTLSLKTALETLVFAPTLHMETLYAQPERLSAWTEAAHLIARGSQSTGRRCSADSGRPSTGRAAPTGARWSRPFPRPGCCSRLLVYEVAEGWAPLCRFLGVAVPVDLPFPHVNDSASFQAFQTDPVAFRRRITEVLGA